MQIPQHLHNFIQLMLKNGSQIRLIGGCVRDFLVNIPSADIDLACNLPAEKIMQICRENKIKTIATGLQHGTITVVLNKINYEVTTLRRDIACDGRHAEVEFTTDWYLDAARRDLTFNALSIEIHADGSYQIYDYYNGINDLKNGILRFIGSPLQRIQEDYLRILRAFRFYARFCHQPLDPQTSQAILAEKHNLKKISGERIKSEVFNILSKKNSALALQMMQNHDLNPYVFGVEKKFDLSFLQHINKFKITSDPLTILAILMHFEKLELNFFVQRWRISRYERNVFKNLMNHNNFFDINDEIIEFRYILAKFEPEIREKLLIFNFYRDKSNWQEGNINTLFQAQERLKKISINPNPVRGHDFQNLRPKSKISQALQIADQIWHNSDYQISKNEIIEQTKKIINEK